MDDISPLPRTQVPADWPAPEELAFGAHLGPYLVSAVHDARGWSPLSVQPREALRLPLASGGLQYALSVFEGLKVYRGPDGAAHLFRPRAHAQRLAASARRLSLPAVDAELFLDACRLAAVVHEALLPPHGRGSLYLRPTLCADEESLGLRPATRHRFAVAVNPCCDPPLKSLRLWAEPEWVRAAPGGLGAAKTGANYAAGIGGLMRARERGFDDVAWLDAESHRFLGEAGTMNLFVQIGEQWATPPLDGTILAGVTRDSLLRLMASEGLSVEERPIGLNELVAAMDAGTLGEAFGCGTATRLARIIEIHDGDRAIGFAQGSQVPRLAAALKRVQEAADCLDREWCVPVAAS